MKRSVIQLATNTLVVSLPSKWAHQQGLKKGDSVEVQEQEQGLVIAADKASGERKKVLQAGALKVMLGRAIGALYKAGFDEIEVQFEEKAQLDSIQEVLRRTCIGFEIVEQSRTRVVAKEISKAEAGEFDKVLRQAFMFVLSMADDTLDAAKKKDQAGLDAIPLMDSTVNRYTDFCRRLLNKQHHTLSGPLYYLSEQIERIGDLYAELAPTLHDEKEIKLLGDVNAFLRQYYETYYKSNHTNIEELGVQYKLLKKKVADYPRLKFIVQTIFDMNGALLVLRLS